MRNEVVTSALILLLGGIAIELIVWFLKRFPARTMFTLLILDLVAFAGVIAIAGSGSSVWTLPVPWHGLTARDGFERTNAASVNQSVASDQTFMVVSSAMNVPALGHCPSAPTTLCVMAWPGASNTQAFVDGLRGSSLFGWSEAPADVAIADRLLGPDGWLSQSACGSADSCTQIWIYVVDDGIQVDLALDPPRAPTLCRPYAQLPIGTDTGAQFAAFRGVTGFIDLEYWVGDDARRVRLYLDRMTIGYRLVGSSRYGSLWAYSSVCTPSELAPGFSEWRDGEGLIRLVAPPQR